MISVEKTMQHSAKVRADANLSRAELVEGFWAAPLDALFAEQTTAAVLDMSVAWCQRARWSGEGPPFLRFGRTVRYRKADIVEWLKPCRVTSTSAPMSAE